MRTCFCSSVSFYSSTRFPTLLFFFIFSSSASSSRVRTFIHGRLKRRQATSFVTPTFLARPNFSATTATFRRGIRTCGWCTRMVRKYAYHRKFFHKNTLYSSHSELLYIKLYKYIKYARNV